MQQNCQTNFPKQINREKLNEYNYGSNKGYLKYIILLELFKNIECDML